jgi:hypothetical protein
MTSTNHQATPLGLYILSGFSQLSIFGILYYAFVASFYLYLAIILIPPIIYMGIGIIKRCPGAKQTVMAFAILLFIGAFVDIGAALFIEESHTLTSIGSVIGLITRMAILPSVYFYFISEKVRSYFKTAK